MKSVYNRIIIIILATAFLTLLSVGCSTTAGFGKDVEDLGEAIQGE